MNPTQAQALEALKTGHKALLAMNMPMGLFQSSERNYALTTLKEAISALSSPSSSFAVMDEKGEANPLWLAHEHMRLHLEHYKPGFSVFDAVSAALTSPAPSAAEPVALTEKQRRVLEHYNFAQFDADKLAQVPEAIRRDLWDMLDEMISADQSAAEDAKDGEGANQCVWPDQHHEAGRGGYCLHCGAAMTKEKQG